MRSALLEKDKKIAVVVKRAKQLPSGDTGCIIKSLKRINTAHQQKRTVVRRRDDDWCETQLEKENQRKNANLKS